VTASVKPGRLRDRIGEESNAGSRPHRGDNERHPRLLHATGRPATSRGHVAVLDWDKFATHAIG
jgi:hypothetical protein